MAQKKKKLVKKKKPSSKRPAKKKAVRRPVTKAVKKVKKPALKKKPLAKKQLKAKKKPAQEKGFLGEVTHYFPKVNAAVLKLKDTLSVGDTIRIKGHTTDFTETVNSMQIDHMPLTVAKKGDEIGLQVKSRVRRGDSVLKV
jgi:putative protease